MNPPYGGNEDEILKTNFPAELRSSETADLFVILIMYRLKMNGKVGLVLPDGFLFGDGSKAKVKEKLLTEFNLHTVIRLPQSVFAPYTSINTNLLFFDNNGEGTKNTWFYRMDMPEGLKHFNKTNPIKLNHFDVVDEWWNKRIEIKDPKEDENMTETWKARQYSFKELADDNFNLDKCGYPIKEEIIYSPEETIKNFIDRRNELDLEMDEQLDRIMNLLGVK